MEDCQHVWDGHCVKAVLDLSFQTADWKWLLHQTDMDISAEICAMPSGDGVLGACCGWQRPYNTAAREDLEGKADALGSPLLSMAH